MKWTRILGSIVAVSVLGGIFTGCSSGQIQEGGISCNFQINDVHRSHGNLALMDVKATGDCNGPVARATVKIYYQKKVGNAWSTVAASVEDRTFPLVPGKKYTFMSAKGTACKPGTYRGVAHVSVYNNQGRSNSATLYSPHEAVVTC